MLNPNPATTHAAAKMKNSLECASAGRGSSNYSLGAILPPAGHTALSRSNFASRATSKRVGNVSYQAFVTNALSSERPSPDGSRLRFTSSAISKSLTLARSGEIFNSRRCSRFTLDPPHRSQHGFHLPKIGGRNRTHVTPPATTRNRDRSPRTPLQPSGTIAHRPRMGRRHVVLKADRLSEPLQASHGRTYGTLT